jgi:uncharacterized membrane protein YebE (DUF533 family)
MPDEEPAGILATCAKHKGKLAGGVGGTAGLAGAVLLAMQCYHDFSSDIKRNKDTADGNVPQWLYQSDRLEMESNIVEILIQQRQGKCNCAKTP